VPCRAVSCRVVPCRAVPCRDVSCRGVGSSVGQCGVVASPDVLDRSRAGGTGKAVQGTAEQAAARHGTARHGTARHGTARHGTARHDTAQHGTFASWSKYWHGIKQAEREASEIRVTRTSIIQVLSLLAGVAIERANFDPKAADYDMINQVLLSTSSYLVPAGTVDSNLLLISYDVVVRRDPFADGLLLSATS